MRTHGRPGTYWAGCHCTDCVDAAARYRAAWRADQAAGRPRYVDAGPARDHLARLVDAGIPVTRVATLCAASEATVLSLWHRRSRRIQRGTAEAVLSVPIPHGSQAPQRGCRLMSCSKPGLNAAGRSLYSAYGAPHTRFHEHLKAVDVDLRARGKNPNAPASDALTQAQLERMRITADQAARHGDTTPAQQATITKHLDGAQAAAAAGQRPKVREVVALRRMHSEYAPRPDAQARLAAATSRAARAKVAAGQLALRQARGDAIAPATAAQVTQERADALTELQAATTAAAPTGGSSDAQRCPTCGQFTSPNHQCPTAGSLPPGDYAGIKGTERVETMVADLEASVKTIVESGQLHRWLHVMASNGLTRWSANNRLLAALQMLQRGQSLEDLHMMGFRQWEKFNRQVSKGAKAVWILAPITRTVVDENSDGETTERNRVVGYKSVPVFDISDTHGDPLPASPTTPAPGAATPGTIEGLRDRVAQAGYTYEEADIPGCRPSTGDGTLGFTDPRSRRIVVDQRLSDAQKASTIAHELGHVHCGHVDRDYSEYQRHRGQMETEAEVVAFMVCRRRGATREQVEAFSPGYIAGWSHGDPAVMRKALDRAVHAQNVIMDGDWPDGADS